MTITDNEYRILKTVSQAGASHAFGMSTDEVVDAVGTGSPVRYAKCDGYSQLYAASQG